MTPPVEVTNYFEQFISKADDAGMTASLYKAFDDLHLGAVPSTLIDIAALSLIFASMQGADVEALLNKKFTELKGYAEHKLPIPVITNLSRIVETDKTIVMTLKHKIPVEEIIEIKDPPVVEEEDSEIVLDTVPA